ncbi:MAG: substrate-binding domain-containing protein, partial [Bdellovibrionales bacterium]|nr:substrate-binding domain-containing protein [Bdellovibrionales bacterium]
MRSQPLLRTKFTKMFSVLVFSLSLSTIAAADQLPEYQPRNIGKTSLSSVGSDSMENLVDLWAKEFGKFHPETDIQVVSRGSASAPAALIEGTADVGPMARPMKSVELDKFKRSYGFEPTQIRTAMAGVAIYVSKNNPIKSISFEELDALYSKSLNRGSKAVITSWKDLGVEQGLASSDVMALGAGLNSYTRSFFRQQV